MCGLLGVIVQLSSPVQHQIVLRTDVLQLAPATELLFGNRVSEGFFSKGLPSDLFTVFKTFASARAEYLALPLGEGRMLLSAQESSLVSEVESLPSLAGIHRAVDKAV